MIILFTAIFIVSKTAVNDVVAETENFSFETDITHKWGKWTFDENTAIADNGDGGWWNEFIVSNKYATKEQNVVMKADITYQSGNGSGLVFGIPTNYDPGAQWYSFNLYRDITDSGMGVFVRFFSVNVNGGIGDTHDYRYDLTQEEIDNGVYSLELRIDNGGTLRGYFNGKLVAAVHDLAYNGGYLGFMTFHSSVTYNNVEVKVSDAPSSSTPGIDEEEFTNLNPKNDIKHSWGRWYSDANSVSAINKDSGDLFAMTDIYVADNQDLIYEADLTRLGNTYCAMLVFGASYANDPGRGWYALNIQYDSQPFTRLYSANKGNLGGTIDARRKYLNDDSVNLKTHRLRVEAYANGRIIVSIDGVVFSDTYDSKYHGGYIGLGTFWGAFMFENIRYKITDSNELEYSTNGEVELDALDLRSAYFWGDWKYTKDSLSANHLNYGNQFSMSTLYVSSEQNFSFEADVAASGNSVALTFGVTDIADPIKGWYALAISKDGGSARVFSEGKGCIGTASKFNTTLTSKQKSAPTIHLRIEGYASGRIMAWVDGELICDIVDPTWNGGYLGFNTFFSSAIFTNIKYSITNNNGGLTKLKVGGHEINFEENQYGNVVEFPKGVNTADIEVEVKDGYRVQIEDVIDTKLVYDIDKAISLVEIKVLDSEDNIVSIYHVEIKRFYDEQYRPGYHFTEAETWINDPNGLVYDSTTDTYHMFYQYCVGVNNSGYFYWGHAVSKDLMTWERKEPALAPDQYGIIFSGSCIVDENNDLGLFPETVPAASRLVAFYTYHSSNPSIGMAYSLDFGQTWIKYGRVIINENNLYGDQFRDPKVIYVEDKWLMIVGGITFTRLFSSTDLVNWTLDSEVMDYYGNNLVTECPDIFPLAVDGNPNNVKWVISTAGTSYIVGSLNKNEEGKFVFIAEAPGYKMYNSPTLWTNIGEVYATQSYYNDREGRRILVSWMVDRTANTLEDKWWNGAESIPLETTLITKNGMIVMCGYPIKEFESLREEKLIEINDVKLNGVDNPLEGIISNQFDMEVEIEVKTAKTITIAFCKGENQETTFTYDVQRRVLSLDASKSGQITKYVVPASVTTKGGILSLRITVDVSVVELFANGGEQSYHGFIFPDRGSKNMSINCEGGEATIKSLTVWTMKNIH